jgi:hypothetical protein
MNIIFSILAFLLLIFPVLAITEYSKTIWNDFYIFPYSYPSNYQFFSLFQFNVTNFFVGYLDGLNLCIDMYSEYGYRERSSCRDYIFITPITFRNAWISDDPIIWRYDDVVFPIYYLDFYSRKFIGVFRVNLSEYPDGNWFRYSFSDSLGSGSYITNLGVSEPLIKDNFPSGASPGIDSNVTFAIAYADVNGNVKLIYDFYDLQTGSFDYSRAKEIDFSSGLSDVKKVYPIFTKCFYYALCHPMHLIFEGRSAQNGNRYGIYIRETWLDPLFGFRRYRDIGLIGFNESIGFRTYGDVTNWFYNFYTNLFYVKFQDEDRRPWFVYQFNPLDWGVKDVYVINWYDNNLLVNYAKTLLQTGYIFSGTGYFEFWLNNTELKALASPTNKTYISGLVTSLSGYYAYVNVTLQLYNNSNLVYSSSKFINVFGHRDPISFVFDVNLERNISFYNIRFIVDTGIYDSYRFELVNDIVTSNSIVRTTPTGGVTGLVESFGIVDNDYFAFQVPSTATCYCTDFNRVGCINTTHSLWTRVCYPSGCSFEQVYLADAECFNYTAPPPTPPPSPPPIPGVPPGVGYTGGLFNLTERAVDLNITGPALVGIAILDRIFSLAGIATIISIAAGIAVGYITRNGHVAAIAILLSVIFFTLAGFYPWWFGIVFIIIAGLIITIIFREAF